MINNELELYDQTPVGQHIQIIGTAFQFVRVPDDENCLFAAIGYFVDPELHGLLQNLGPQATPEQVQATQARIRQDIHDFAQNVLDEQRENPNIEAFSDGFLTEVVSMTEAGTNRYG
jgi:hypothetical protein